MLEVFEFLEDVLWSYVDFLLIMTIGFYLTLKSKFFQFKAIMTPIKTFKTLINETKDKKTRGINPIRLYFSSMGGAIGIGNVGACITAVTIGGPGGLLWMWIAVFVGMLVKYSEIFLGIKYRVHNETGGYDGGAPLYLIHAFNKRWICVVFCVLQCIYGVEIYQFKVVEDVFVDTFGVNRYLVVAILLSVTMYVTLGGIQRLSIVCTALMPLFLLMYTGVCLYVMFHSNADFVALLSTVFKSAFTGHAAVGGFAGSTFLMAVNNGMSRAVYSGDIGIGYDAVIQSETKVTDPCLQARLTVFSLFTDCLICTLTIGLVLSTGQWCIGHKTPFECVVCALSGCFSYAEIPMAVFYFFAGWTTVLGYLAVGVKGAKAISPKNGRNFFLIYAVCVLVVFSFIEQSTAMIVMSVSGGGLLFINLLGIFKLRKDLVFPKDLIVES